MDEIVKREKKNRTSDKAEFSDAELADEMEEELEVIHAMSLAHFDRAKLINDKYSEKKRNKKLKDIKERREGAAGLPKASTSHI